ncbi:MAG: MerR family transcriptional regulator [Acidobacteriota bacterium]
MNTNIPDKLTFKKREVINITRLDGKVLDYWEKEFNVINPVINRNGEKYFSRKDIEIIIRIKELLMGERKSKEETKSIIFSEFENGQAPVEKVEKSKAKPGKSLSSLKEGLREILTLIDKNDK